MVKCNIEVPQKIKFCSMTYSIIPYSDRDSIPYFEFYAAFRSPMFPFEGVIVEGLSELNIKTTQDAEELLQFGRRQLVVAETRMVRLSSRSVCITPYCHIIIVFASAIEYFEK